MLMLKVHDTPNQGQHFLPDVITLALTFRFQASTSFDCDGCNHHASFHSMENPAENEVLKRWQAIEKERQDSATGTGSRKRPRRAIENGTTASTIYRRKPFGAEVLFMND